MGYRAASAAGGELAWTDPAFMATPPTQLLVAFWVKVTSWTGETWGPALFKTDFAAGGWWVFDENATDKLTIGGYPGAAGVTLVAAPVLNQGWIHTGFWINAAGDCQTYKNGVPIDFTGALTTGVLTDTAVVIKAIAGGIGKLVAEAAIWARADSALTVTVANAIMTKLANPAHAQKHAIDITDLAVNWYAPLYDDTDEVVGATTGTGTLVDAGDHPWAEEVVIPISVGDTVGLTEQFATPVLVEQEGIVVTEPWTVADTAAGVLNGTHAWTTFAFPQAGGVAFSPSDILRVQGNQPIAHGNGTISRVEVGRCESPLAGLDQQAEVVLGPLEAGGYQFDAGVALRMNATLPTTFYGFVADLAGSTVSVWRVVGDGREILATATFTAAVGATLTGRVTGQAPIHLELLIDGVSRLIFDDAGSARITTGLRHGVILSPGRFMTAANGVDTYTARDIGAIAAAVAVGDSLGLSEGLTRALVGAPPVSMGPATVITTDTEVEGTLGAWPDSGLGIVYNGDGTWTFWGAAGGFIGEVDNGNPGQTIGTMANVASGAQLRTFISAEKTAPDSAPPFFYQGGGPVYKDPGTGRLLLFTHTELYFGPSFHGSQYYSWLGLVTSTDGGNSWIDCGAIITPHHSFAEMAALYDFYGKSDGSGYNAEIGYGQFLLIDGYFYVYYPNVDSPITSIGLNRSEKCVARSPVTTVLAAAATGTVTAWEKYTGGGTWAQPGIRGTSVPVWGTDGDGGFLFAIGYNAHRNRYISIAHHWDNFPGARLFYRESTDGLTWTGGVMVPGGPTDINALDPFYNYYWFMDPDVLTDPNHLTLGETFYLTAKHMGATTGTHDLYRFPVTVTAAAQVFTAAPADTVTLTESLTPVLDAAPMVFAKTVGDTLVITNEVLTLALVGQASVTLDNFVVTAAGAVDLGDPLALSETLARVLVVTRQVAVGDAMGLNEQLARLLITIAQVATADTLALTEGFALVLVPAATFDLDFTESVTLSEGLAVSPVVPILITIDETVGFVELLSAALNPPGSPDAGIFYLTGETFRISAGGSDLEVGGIARVLRTVCKRPVPERSALEYRGILQNAGIPVTAANLESLTLTLQHLADGTILNGIDRINILNTNRGLLGEDGRLLVGLDAEDLAILSPVAVYEKRLLTIEGEYAARRRVFRKEVEFVLINLMRVT